MNQIKTKKNLLNWELVSVNPNDKNWNWNEISKHSNITFEIIQTNPDKPWKWGGILENTMELGKQRWINQRRLKHIKAFQIQRHWRNCSCNPEFKLAQRCLLRLHES